MHRSTTLLLTAVATVLTHGFAQATDHIYINVAPGQTKGAGFGELTPNAKDLRITLSSPSGWEFYDAGASDMTGNTLWGEESYSPTSRTLIAYGAQEDELGWVSVSGSIFQPPDPGWEGESFWVLVANALWPCSPCEYDPETGMPVNPDNCDSVFICGTTQEGIIEIEWTGETSTSISVHHGLSGTLTILGASGGLEILNPDETPFTSAYLAGEGVSLVPVVIRADDSFTGPTILTARFLQDNADLDSQDIVAVQVAKYEFSSLGAIKILSQPANAETNKVGMGTTPYDGAKVSPSQTVVFSLSAEDPDQFRRPGQAWQGFRAPERWGTYDVKITLTNATYTDGTPQKTYQAVRDAPGQFALLNVVIKVNPDWDESEDGAVKLTLEITDKVTIPQPRLAAGQVATNLRDEPVTFEINWHKATVFPETQTPIKQVHLDAGPPQEAVQSPVGSQQTTEFLFVWYSYGPAAPRAYEGVTVQEVFRPDQTSNLKKEWLKDSIRNMHPDWTDAQWVKLYFPVDGAFMVSTFVISAEHHTTDTMAGHDQMRRLERDLNAAGLAATIYADLDQHYQCPPGTFLQGPPYNMRSQRTGGEPATFQFRLWKP